MTMILDTHSARVGAPQQRHRTADILAVAGSLIAPLNLLVIRALTLYDVLLCVAFVLLLRQRRLVWPGRKYLVASYIFTVAALLSAFRSMYAIEALTQLLQYLFIFFVQLPVLLSVISTRRRALVCIVLLCVGTLGAILHAYLFPQTQGAGRNLVFYSENPNRLGYPASYLLPFIFVLWHLSRGLRLSQRLYVALGCGAATYLSVWAVLASGSRSSLFGTAVALLVLILLRPGLSPARWFKRTLVLSAAVGALILSVAVSGNTPTTLEERVNRTVASGDTDDRAGLIGDRLHLAQAAALAFVESPYIGTGLDNFRYVTMTYSTEATPQAPHNLWLQLLTQVGFFGTAAFGAVLLFWMRDAVHAVRRAAAPDQELLWGCAASLAGSLTIVMFAPEMLDRHYWLIFALGLAAATGALRGRHHLGGTS